MHTIRKLSHRKSVAADLRRIYEAATAELTANELDAFEEKRAGKQASIAPAWRRAWQEGIPFFAFDPAIRKTIHTKNAMGSLNRVIRKLKTMLPDHGLDVQKALLDQFDAIELLKRASL